MHLPLTTLNVLLDWDRRWSRRLNASVDIRMVRNLFRVASRLGDGVFWYSAIVALAVTQGQDGIDVGLRMLAAGAVALVLYKLLKSRTHRARPYEVLAGIRPGIAPLDARSFPSGHTLHAVAFTIVGVSLMPTLAWIFFPFTLLVAASRVVLGLHYPSDVLAGAAIGAGVAQMILAF